MTETNCFLQFQRQIFPDLAKPKLLAVGTKLHAQGLGLFSLNGPAFSSKGEECEELQVPKEFSVK